MCSPQIILDKIVEKIVDTVIQSVVCHIRFVCCYKGSLEKLDVEKQNLEEQRQKVNEEVDKYKTLGEDIEANVSNWQTEADKMIKEVEEFVNHKTDKESMQCFKFSCPDYISRYKLSKQAERKIGDIKNLAQKGKFDKVSHPKPPPQKLLFPSSADFVSLDYMSFDSREAIFMRIMDALKDSKVYKIGVHGLGGVGKTKMVEEVGKQVKKDGLFDEVVMAVVSQDANVSKIQFQLIGGLNPKPEVATTDEHERAIQLWRRLDNEKKNLIILDDIWQELSLDAIGIPITGKNKVVITSRNRDVWKNMEMDTEIQIKVLSETEAWALFKKKVGNSVDSPELHAIAKEVCKECQGLPVAILVVGGALKGKEKHVWKNALEKLKKSMLKKIEGISPKLYESMKLSYDYLSMDAKSCFLLCCMFPEDAEIPIDELVRHCTARGLLDQKPDTLEEARDAVRTVVDTLKTCSLLLDGTNKNFVKMHDVIRDVAVSIADDEKAILVKHDVHEWPKKGTYESYLAISLRSKTVHEVPNKLGCSQLHTLLLECIDPSVIIPDMFFNGMEKLTVLELNGVRMLQLPPSLANLVNLRMLCLNKCQLEDITILKDLKNNLEVLSLRGSDIKALPSEIGQLTQLRLLDLRECNKLSKIPPGVISNLSRLEELYIVDSFEQWEDATANKERSKVSLDELRKLTQLTTLHIHIPNAMLLPKDIRFENLIRFIISMGKRFYYLDYREYQSSTRMFKLVGVPFRDAFNVLLERAEVLHLDKVEGLRKVYHGLYPSCGRGLLQIQRLVIKQCEVMEGIVGNEGEKNEEAVTSEAINFSQLKYMELEWLPSLVSFYPKMEKMTTAKENSFTQAHSLFNEKVSFPALEELFIRGLPNLTEIWDRKLLPLESFKELRDVTIRSCVQLVNVGSSNIHRQLPKLKNLDVRGCRELKVVVLENEEEENAENNTSTISFPQLTRLNLGDLMSLKSFCISGSETQSLFTGQVTFPALEELYIDELPKLTEIWDRKLLPLESFKELRDVTIRRCEQLVNVGSSNIHRQLPKLKKLHVGGCRELKVVVLENGEEENAENNTSTISFPQLTRLNLEQLRSLKSFCTSGSETQSLFTSQVSFPALKEFFIRRLPKLTEIWDRKLLPLESFKELRDVTIWRCEKLVNVGSSNIHRQLPKLKNLDVQGCQELKVVVLENGEEENAENSTSTISFPQLTRLNLEELMSLKSFCISGSETQSLFTGQVSFPALEELFIRGLPKLTEIWDWKLLPLESFKELRDMTITSCEQLVNVGSSNMHRQLPKLKKLDVKECQELKVVVLENGEEEKAENNTSTILFPQLTRLNLEYLTSLKSICTSGFETQSLFTSQVSFPALEELFILGLPKLTEIWDRKLLPLESFKELGDVTIRSCEQLVNVGSSNIHRQLPKLKKLHVWGCRELKVVVLENGEEENAENNTSTISFPQLTRLDLEYLMSLKSFCTSGSETQSLFTSQVSFPALEELFIRELPNLTEIWDRKLLPLESFKELRDVTIERCAKLVNVGSSNMHRQLPKLKELNVWICRELKVVVLENGEEENAENNTSTISFPQLTRLNLEQLMSLKSFCTSGSETQSLFTSQVSFPALEELFIRELPNLTEIWDRKLLPLESFKELRDVTIERCAKLVNVGSSNMHRQLPKLKKLNVCICRELKVVVLENGEEENAENNTSTISFPQLTRLNLEQLMSLKSFCTSGSETQSLFTSQVSFPALEELFILVLPKLTEIWDRKLLPLESFKELRDVTIRSCVQLVNVGSSNIHRQLPKLKNLDVRGCRELKVVVLENGEEENAENNTSTISFPQLTRLNLVNLMSLKSFCTSGSEKQSLFTSQVSFPALEELFIRELPNLTEIWDRKLLPLESFKELRDVTIESCAKLVNVGSSNMHRQLPKLKKLNVWGCRELKVVVLENGEEENAENNTSTISFPQLTRLNLEYLMSLKSFCTSGSETQSLFTSHVSFPALEELFIRGLPNLTEIWDRKLLPLESFKELRDVTIKSCAKLVNVGSSNMHRQLPKLKKLDVRDVGS